METSGLRKQHRDRRHRASCSASFWRRWSGLRMSARPGCTMHWSSRNSSGSTEGRRNRFFLAQHRDAVEQLARSRPLAMYLANRELGMSLHDGLKLSLMAVTRVRIFHQGEQDGACRISAHRIRRENGHLLLDVGGGQAAIPNSHYQVLRTTDHRRSPGPASQRRCRADTGRGHPQGGVLPVMSRRAAGRRDPVTHAGRPQGGIPDPPYRPITNAGTVLAAAGWEDWNGWRTTADKAGRRYSKPGSSEPTFRRHAAWRRHQPQRRPRPGSSWRWA